MKKLRNNSDRASTLQVALATGLILISAVLFAITPPTKTEKTSRPDLSALQVVAVADADSSTTPGNYPDTSVPLSGDTTVTPDATPADTTSINGSTDTNFKGTFAVSPMTGVVTVTDAHPAGSYTVTLTAFGPGGTTTKTFTLTVTSTPCGAGFTNVFTNAANVGVGSDPHSIAIGDFNGDGKQDLAVANQSSNTVSIRLGDGSGGFGGSTNVSASPIPVSVAIGDFNGDGKQDLAVANYSVSGTVSIRLGDGLGGFSGSTNVSVGSYPNSVAIGDFNGDGKQDLAVANLGADTVSILLGDGLGGFSGSTNVNVGSQPNSVAIGDFNGDGRQDLAVANFISNTVSIRLGDGLGGFSHSTEVSGGFRPISVAIGDFNGDGKQDLAVANYDSNTVSIRLGDGLGGFSGSTQVSGSSPGSVAIGDFNGDGKQDLAFANYGAQGSGTTVSIRLGDGLGGFSGATEVSVGSSPLSVAIGDFNGDGKQDFAVARAGFTSNTVSIRLGQCVTAPTPTPTATGTPPSPTPTATATVCCHSPTPTVTATATARARPTASATATATATATAIATVTPTASPAACAVTEGFENITTLVSSGWVRQNNTQPAGTAEWFQGGANLGWPQGNETFAAQSGPLTSYIAADFLDGSGLATISNWLLTPPVTLQNGAKFSFWTRTANAPVFPDHLQVRMSTNGASSNVGALPTDTGDFTTLLLDINPTYSPGGYPNVWTNFVVTISGLGGPVTGRLAFRYFVENGGPSGANSDYIGIDAVAYDCNGILPTPTPATTPTPTVTPTPGTPVSFISGTIFYCSSPVPNVRVNVTGTVTGSTLSDGSGNYQFRFLPWAGSFTLTPARATLAPGSAGFDSVDVIAVLRHFLQIGTPLSGCRLAAADVNGNNAINTVDVVAIQRFFLGLSTGIANVGDFQFTPASRSYTGNGTNWTDQNYDVVVLGDVAPPFAVP